MLKKWLAASFLISVLVNAKESRDFFVGINGSPSYQGNYSVFEDEDLMGFYESYSKDRQIILSSEGPTAQFMNLSTELGVIDTVKRSIWGDTLYRGAKIQDSRPATLLEINAGIASISKQSPEKVLILYGNHGLPDGPSAIDGTIDRKTIEKHEGFFSADTVVQRINLHCYSGEMLYNNEAGQYLYDINSVQDLKKFFKPNRCALVNTKVGIARVEFSLADYIKQNPKANLQDVYQEMQLRLVESDPELTSTAFMEAYWKLRCVMQTEAKVCLAGVDCDGSKKLCKDFENTFIEEDIGMLRQKIKGDTIRDIYGEIGGSLLEQKHPKLFQSYKEALEKYNTIIMCRELGVMGSEVSECKQSLEGELDQVWDVFRKYEKVSEEYFNFDNVDSPVGQEIKRLIIEKRGASEDEIENARLYYDMRLDIKFKPEYAERILRRTKAMKAIEEDLKNHPSLKELYDSIVACEKMPLLPRK